MDTVNCQLCQIDKINVVIESQYCLFTQIPQKVLKGSGIIVPRAHRMSVFELTEEEWIDTREMLQRVKILLDEEYRPDGYNLGWNVGGVAGQEIFHAHLHVIPRFRDEPFAGKGIRWWLKQKENVRQ